MGREVSFPTGTREGDAGPGAGQRADQLRLEEGAARVGWTQGPVRSLKIRISPF